MSKEATDLGARAMSDTWTDRRFILDDRSLSGAIYKRDMAVTEYLILCQELQQQRKDLSMTQIKVLGKKVALSLARHCFVHVDFQRTDMLLLETPP